MYPRLLLTSGEPAGIGPDLCLLMAQKTFPCALTVVADPALLEARAALLGLDVRIENVGLSDESRLHQAGSLSVLPVSGAGNAVCGRLDRNYSDYVLRTIATATRACLSGRHDGLVTAPVHKGIINEAGIEFTGHTEFIAGLTGGYPVMMLATEGLRVALATTHLPLAAVSSAITAESLETVLRVLHADLASRFGIVDPRILVCGLNPHAGEGGHLGREELLIIEPVLESLRQEGVNVRGPLPADTLFLPKYLDYADAVLAMYHDQGLPVLKYAGFGRAVNITLGLPIIRTSVDHGTALDLAGTGRIESGSLEFAIETAIAMVNHESSRIDKEE